MTESIITGAVAPEDIGFPPLPLLGTWERAAGTAAEEPAAAPLDPADEESGLEVTSGTVALEGIVPDAMGGVGRAIDPDPLLADPAGVWTWYVPVACVGEVYGGC